MKINVLCELLGYSKQAYYKRLHHQEQEALNEYLIIEMIRQKRKLWKRGSGRNLFAALKRNFIRHNITIGRDKFFDILRANGLLIKRKRKHAITTQSYHHYHKYPNLIEEIIPLKANEIWVADITYIWIEGIEEFAYLFMITDMYCRKIIGYCVSEDLSSKSALVALRIAIQHAGKDLVKGCIHHSDRGVQYCCHAYTGLLKKTEMKISMTENGDPRENPIAERVNRTIKEEFTDEKTITFVSVTEAKKQLPKFIKFYNDERPHSSIDWLTPAQAYNTIGELKRRWKAYYKKEKTTYEFSEA